MVFSSTPSDCFEAFVEYSCLYTLLSMIAKVHISLNRFVLPLPSARGMLPMLSLGSSLGRSTFMSSSSCAGGLPDRRQILAIVSHGFLGSMGQTHSLSKR